MSPQNRCTGLAPPRAARRDSKDDAGSNAACRTVSDNKGKLFPGMAERLLAKRDFRDQTKAGMS